MEKEGKNIPDKGNSSRKAPQPKKIMVGETGEGRGLENRKRARVARGQGGRGWLCHIPSREPGASDRATGSETGKAGRG